MNKQLNVLVLGVGGNVSQGILKALSVSALKPRVIGACISPLSPGLYMADSAYVAPFASDPGFIDWVIEICRKEQIDAVLSGVEPNLTVLAQHTDKIRAQTGAVCVVSRPEVLAIGDDKLKTCQWLQENQLNFPRYAALCDPDAAWRLVKECGYPLIAKPRSGRGGVGILKVKNDAGLNYALSFPDYVLEECLGSDETEYTVGTFVDKDGILRGTIGMHRELQQGTTCRAELGEFPEVRAEAARIAQALQAMGPANVQLRVSDGRPVCFEINVRFSGTTPMRARFGWNDVEVALRHFVLGEPARDFANVTKGMVLRYWDELYIDQRGSDQLSEKGSLENPRQYEMKEALAI